MVTLGLGAGCFSGADTPSCRVALEQRVSEADGNGAEGGMMPFIECVCAAGESTAQLPAKLHVQLTCSPLCPPITCCCSPLRTGERGVQDE